MSEAAPATPIEAQRACETPDLWLPPRLRAPPPPGQAPRIIIPERYGRPRTEAEHAYYKKIIAEGAALVAQAKAERVAALDAWFTRIEVAPRAPDADEFDPEAFAVDMVRADASLEVEEAPLEAETSIDLSALAAKSDAPIVGEATPGRGAGAPKVHREADGFIVNDPAVEAPKLVGDAALIRAGLKAEVRHRKQIGGTCGLYALGMVMDYWHDKDAKHPTALVQPADREPVNDPRGFVHYHHAPTDERYLLEVAMQEGFSAKGEMYQAAFVAETAARFGYEASLRTEATLDDVYAVLDAGHPAIVPFNVDMNGEAGTPDPGARAHYAVLEGYFDHAGERYVIAKHSWSKTEDKVWRAKDFFASWDNLRTTKFYGTPGDGEIPNRPDLVEPARLTLPDAGGGRADISRALARTLVEVVPPGEPLTGGQRFAAQAQGG